MWSGLKVPSHVAFTERILGGMLDGKMEGPIMHPGRWMQMQLRAAACLCHWLVCDALVNSAITESFCLEDQAGMIFKSCLKDVVRGAIV